MASFFKGEFGRPRRVKDAEEQAKLDARYVKRLEAALKENGEDPRWSAIQALAWAAIIAVIVRGHSGSSPVAGKHKG